MAKDGVKALLSFGICGGLVPEVKVGDLVLADAVHHHRGGHWTTDETWRQAVHNALAANPRARARVHLGRLTGSAVIVDRPDAKRALAEKTKAIAVDMESHAVAEVAHELGLPMLVVRTCSDAVDHRLPLEALDAVTGDGSFSVLPVTKVLARRPWLIPPLVRLALRTRGALKTLERVILAEEALLRRGGA
jgi:adenosylhomocysteine nucleosidase